MTMTHRERYRAIMNYQPVDRPLLHTVGLWPETLTRWRREGLPVGADLNAYFGIEPLRTRNVSGRTGVWPPFETRRVAEDDTFIIEVDSYGRTVRNFKDHTSMPEWLEFPVKTREDLQRVLDEHFTTDPDARYTAEWAAGLARPAGGGDPLVVLDGGCYYWTLRSLAGVENASYLLCDAEDLVDELFERIAAACIEGIRRATPAVTVDCLGFGEDMAYKNGPLLSPAMFRRLILPRYRRVVAAARARGIVLTWYDSDGDIRSFIPDYLEAGIDTLAPCEVAAGMSCPELRRAYGRRLRFIGGIDKRAVAAGRRAIDAEIERHRPLIEEGGFLPAIDHSVSADISLDNYRYFLDRLQRALGPG